MKTSLKKFLPLLLLLPLALVLLRLRAASSNYAPILSLNVAQWREDLNYLAKELPRRHQNAFHRISRDAFARSIADLDAAIPSLQGNEIMTRLLQITASVGDAQTNLKLPDYLHRFPLTLGWFGNELQVLQTSRHCRPALGCKVVAIEDHPISEVVTSVSNLVPHENEQWIQYVSASYIPCSEILNALKITSDFARSRWTLESDDGKTFSLEIDAVPFGETPDFIFTAKQLPLHLRHASEGFWFCDLDESKTLYVNLRQYTDSEKFRQSAKDLLETINRLHPKRLVIDLRGNTDGDADLVRRHLLPAFKNLDFLQRPLSFFVLIDRGTQSGAMVNAVDFRKMEAVLVGESTGGKPNGYSENKEFTLPNSRLKISFATRYAKLLDDDTPSLIPHKQIETSWKEFAAGRDPVMDWVLSQPYRGYEQASHLSQN